MNNFFHAYKNRGTTFKVAFTGIMLAMVLLFQFLERFMPFAGTYINLNFTLLFILPVFYFAGWQFGIIILLTRLIIGPAFSTNAYDTTSMVSQFILLTCSSVVIIMMYIFSAIFSRIKSHNVKVILISTCTVLFSSVALAALNGVIFTPLFWYVLNIIKHPSIHDASNAYNNYAPLHLHFLGISKYWPAVMITYSVGNLVKYTIVYILYLPMSIIFRKFVFPENNYHSNSDEVNSVEFFDE